jgi:hypothetical protein
MMSTLVNHYTPSSGRFPDMALLIPANGLPPTYPLTGIPINIATGDFDGDGKIDAVSGCFPINTGDPNLLCIALNVGTGKLNRIQAVQLPIKPHRIATGDLNGDGLTDVIVGSNYDTRVFVLLNNTK